MCRGGGSGSAVHEKIAYDILESILSGDDRRRKCEMLKRKRGCFPFSSMIKEVQNV